MSSSIQVIVGNKAIRKYVPAKNFKQFSDTVMSLRFINKMEKDIVDGSSDKRSQVQEFAVYPM